MLLKISIIHTKYGITKTNMQAETMCASEAETDTCSHIMLHTEVKYSIKTEEKKQNSDSPSLISAHLKSFSVCRMLRGICVNELHHSCEMMAQLGKQKCKV